jgi:hypothetical protein
MASGKLQRAQAKAQRRKKLLAERRKAAAADVRRGQATEIRRAASAPIEGCFVQRGWAERGNGMVILTRRTSTWSLASATFLLDTFCLGVKDVMFRQGDQAEIEMMVEEAGRMMPLEAVDPSYARKLLHDAVAYARSLGIEPHADYAAAEQLFGDVDADACTVAFEFGRDGRPCYIPGPGESPTQIRRRTAALRRTLGEDGFDFVAADDEFDLLDVDEDYDEWGDDDGGYDPDIVPDPEAWQALDEDERVGRVAGYHRRAGFPDEQTELHAILHVIVENQAALGDEIPVRSTLERLMGEGLSRHEAIHAVGTVLTERISRMKRGESADETFGDAYAAAIEQLTAAGWRRAFEEDEETGEG